MSRAEREKLFELWIADDTLATFEEWLEAREKLIRDRMHAWNPRP